MKYKDVCEEFETEGETLKLSIGDCMSTLLGKRKSDTENVNSSKLQSIIDLTESDDDEEEEEEKPKIKKFSSAHDFFTLLKKTVSESNEINICILVRVKF